MTMPSNERSSGGTESVPQATIVELAKLYADWTSDDSPDHGLAETRRQSFQGRLEQFAHQNGKIENYFFCSSLPAGAVYTVPSHKQPRVRFRRNPKQIQLHLTFPPDTRAPTWVARQLMRSQALYIEIREILRSRDRAICMELVFALIIQLLRLMGNEDWRQKQIRRDKAASSPAPPEKSPASWAEAPWTELSRLYEVLPITRKRGNLSRRVTPLSALYAPG